MTKLPIHDGQMILNGEKPFTDSNLYLTNRTPAVDFACMPYHLLLCLKSCSLRVFRQGCRESEFGHQLSQSNNTPLPAGEFPVCHARFSPCRTTTLSAGKMFATHMLDS